MIFLHKHLVVISPINLETRKAAESIAKEKGAMMDETTTGIYITWSDNYKVEMEGEDD